MLITGGGTKILIGLVFYVLLAAAAMMLLPLSHGVNGFRCSPTRNCTLDSTTMDAPLDSRNACLRICSQTVSVPGIELHLHWVLFDRH